MQAMNELTDSEVSEKLDLSESSAEALAAAIPAPEGTNEHVWRLYIALLVKKERFNEFQQLLLLYPAEASPTEEEPEEAAATRALINRRINEWIGKEVPAHSAMEILQWRQVLVDGRFAIAISPWKESNFY